MATCFHKLQNCNVQYVCMSIFAANCFQEFLFHVKNHENRLHAKLNWFSVKGSMVHIDVGHAKTLKKKFHDTLIDR